jgi:hypothetical protein
MLIMVILWMKTSILYRKTHKHVHQLLKDVLKVSAVKTKYMIMSVYQNAGQSQYIKTDDSSFERVDEF